MNTHRIKKLAELASFIKAIEFKAKNVNTFGLDKVDWNEEVKVYVVLPEQHFALGFHGNNFLKELNDAIDPVLRKYSNLIEGDIYNEVSGESFKLIDKNTSRLRNKE